LTSGGRATTAGDEAAVLSVLLDAAPVGFAYYDRERRYVHINDSLAAANGRTPAEHIGRTVREMVPRWPSRPNR
jgi:PAS domain-containing protein